jgi:hypothetical protein
MSKNTGDSHYHLQSQGSHLPIQYAQSTVDGKKVLVPVTNLMSIGSNQIQYKEYAALTSPAFGQYIEFQPNENSLIFQEMNLICDFNNNWGTTGSTSTNDYVSVCDGNTLFTRCEFLDSSNNVLYTLNPDQNLITTYELNTIDDMPYVATYMNLGTLAQRSSRWLVNTAAAPASSNLVSNQRIIVPLRFNFLNGAFQLETYRIAAALKIRVYFNSKANIIASNVDGSALADNMVISSCVLQIIANSPSPQQLMTLQATISQPVFSRYLEPYLITHELPIGTSATSALRVQLSQLVGSFTHCLIWIRRPDYENTTNYTLLDNQVSNFAFLDQSGQNLNGNIIIDGDTNRNEHFQKLYPHSNFIGLYYNVWAFTNSIDSSYKGAGAGGYAFTGNEYFQIQLRSAISSNARRLYLLFFKMSYVTIVNQKLLSVK